MATQPVDELLARMLCALRTKRHRIFDDIRSYPAPIPACDQHFNYLLGARDDVSREVAWLESALAEERRDETWRSSLDTLVSSSEFIDRDIGQALKACLDGAAHR